MAKRARSRRGAFGLRGRIVGAVLVTTVVATLVVAAVALLGPLEHSLRNAEQKTLEASEVTSRTSRRPPPFESSGSTCWPMRHHP